MSKTSNQQFLESIIEIFQLVVADGRLTYGDALIILEGLLNIDWQRDNEISVDQPEPPSAQKVPERTFLNRILPWNWSKQG